MRPNDEDDERWRRMPVPQTPSETSMTVRQFRKVGRAEEFRREILDKARSQPAELARLLARWLHQDD